MDRRPTDRKVVVAAARKAAAQLGFASEWIWLFALGFAPYFFNVESAQHFEVDKAIGIRILAIGALAVEGLRALHRESFRADVRRMVGETIRQSRLRPMMVGIALLVVSTLLSTAVSLEPRLSLWGSYERRQGACTFLSYVALFAIAAIRLDARRVERLVTVTCQTALAVSIYALVQASGRDPIPWVFEVARRPTSTFGNANALAGYLVVAFPFVAMRFSDAWRSRSARGGYAFDVRREMALLGTHAFLFGNVVLCSQSVGWFGEPARLALGIALATSAWALRSSSTAAERHSFGTAVLVSGTLWATVSLGAVLTARAHAGGGLGVCVLCLALVASWALRERRAVDDEAREDATRPPDTRIRTLGHGLALLASVATVFLSQARGAQAALLVSMLVFWNIGPRGVTGPRGQGQPTSGSRRLVKIGVQAALAVLLLVFNLSEHPIVRSARALSYFGRIGQWLEVGGGTGRERLLIWRGDAHGSGMLGLVSANPARTIVGYGPETLKAAFARVFPPSLLEGTGHGVTPDRAHQAALDMLYAQGAIGLAALLLTFGSLAWLAFRSARDSASSNAIALSSAALVAIIAHVVDGATGIPTTASILMCWMAFAVVAGHRRITREIEERELPPAAGDRASPLRSRWGAALLLVTLAVVGVWYGNVSNLVAEMFFRGALRQGDDISLPALVARCESTSKAVALAPFEPSYPSELGELLILMSRHAHEGRTLPADNRSSRCAGLLAEPDARGLLLRGRTAIELAYRLNRGDKDRVAQLARVNLLIYRTSGDRTYLDESLRWYERGVSLAPNDVLLLNQRAAAVAMTPDGAIEAERLLRRSLELDGALLETHLQLADFLLSAGRTSEATAEYEHVLRYGASTMWTADGVRLRTVLTKLGEEVELRRRLTRALDEYISSVKAELRIAPASLRAGYVEEIEHAEAMLAQLHLRPDAR